MQHEGLVKFFSRGVGEETKKHIPSFLASLPFSLDLSRSLSPTKPSERQHNHVLGVTWSGWFAFKPWQPVAAPWPLHVLGCVFDIVLASPLPQEVSSVFPTAAPRQPWHLAHMTTVAIKYSGGCGWVVTFKSLDGSGIYKAKYEEQFHLHCCRCSGETWEICIYIDMYMDFGRQ